MGRLTQFIIALLICCPAFGSVHLCDPNLCNGDVVISIPQPPGTKVLIFKVSPDGTRVLYVSNATCKRDLYSVASTGGVSVMVSDLPLNVQDPCFRNVTDEFSFTPDGLFAIWEADRDTDQMYELYSTPILGGRALQLNVNPPFDNDVERHQISCDSRYVVYRQGKDSANRWELFSAQTRVPMSGHRISQAMGMSQAVGDFNVRCDGTVLYQADMTQSGTYKPWMVGVNGGRLYEGIFLDGFETGSVGAWQ